MTTHDTPKASVLDTIGETPLVELDVSPATVPVYAKLETFNPGGSVKDRIGKYILEGLLDRGDIEPGGTIVEPTAGNTGIGMAIAATQLDLDAIFVVPDGFSVEKERLMAALGAEIEHISGDGGMAAATERAREIADTFDNAVVPQQFGTPLNVEAHYRTTGPEIIDALDGEVGAIVVGVGSGGTLTGITRAVREVVPDVHVVAVEPEGSMFGSLLGSEREEGPYKIEGIGTHDPDVTDLLAPDEIDEFRPVSDRDAHAEVKRLAAAEGHLVGSSAGAASVVARQVAEEIAAGERDAPFETVATVFPDGGERYLSKDIYGSFEEWEGK
ncbi:PLP-dependent cysteine synthase family protein [Halorhabdus sp. CBA1104]|uniref:PLP-dependent cysteine synthase family protein n=1 Tax=unclassified Halorhabdus TaxID=2621901 RepID=UPI0012B2A3F0|nr:MULTISPECIES: PLP-dependent cysteine synthase family protein [unclassified Halorhabdus]QGN06563.1 PLP-dependent cysteine synthase family protein [Halorhabdus sp. CBA1104]